MHLEPTTRFAGDPGLVEGETLELRVQATNEQARVAIDRILALVDGQGFRQEDIDTLEIALAEVMNNVVEHAYADSELGDIEVSVTVAAPGLHVTIIDNGEPMPAGRLPGGRMADPEREAHEQAEGGYGLHLIRQLAKKLRYAREGDRNRLSFRIALNKA